MLSAPRRPRLTHVALVFSVLVSVLSASACMAATPKAPVVQIDFMGRSGASAAGWQTVGDGTSGPMTGDVKLNLPDGQASGVALTFRGNWTRVASDANQGAFKDTPWHGVAADFIANGNFSTAEGSIVLAGLDPESGYRVELCSSLQSEKGGGRVVWTATDVDKASPPACGQFDAYADGYKGGTLIVWQAIQPNGDGEITLRVKTANNRQLAPVNAMRITNLAAPESLREKLLAAAAPDKDARNKEPSQARKAKRPPEPLPREDGPQTFTLSPGDGDEAIERAIRSLRAGDTLVFKTGVHTIGRIRIRGHNLIGTEDQPITIRGEDGAVIEGLYDKATNTKAHGPDKESGISVEGRNQWVVVENLEMRHNGTLGVAHGSQHVTYRNCHIHDYSNYALLVNASRWLTVEKCRIHGSTVEHGIYLTSTNTDTVIRNCEFSDTEINGIHINGTGNQRILVENNSFHHLSRGWGACITMMGASDVTVRNNVFYCNLGHIFTITPGKGQSEVDRNLRIVHNTVYQPKGGRTGQVFVVRAPLRKVSVHNNVFVTNTKALAVTEAMIGETTDFDYNVYGPLSGEQMRDAGKEAHGIFGADVRFVEAPGWDDQQADLHIQAGSVGASGAPLLKDLAPTGKAGKSRRPDGPFGAYATTEP